MSYYYGLNQNYASYLNSNASNQFSPSNPNAMFYDSRQFQQGIFYPAVDSNLNYNNVKTRNTSDSLLSLSSQIEFSNIEKKSSYNNYKLNEIVVKKRDSSKKRSSSNDSSSNKTNDDHEINVYNKKILLPDSWTDNKKKSNSKKAFFNGKILNKSISTSNSSLNLIEIKKEFQIKKIWRKVFS